MRASFVFGLALLSQIATAQVPCTSCNLVIIALDATQAAHIHHLGYAKETTPNLDALAKRSSVFKQAISPASWTVPTYLSLFSSMPPSAHGLVNRYRIFNKEKKELANFATRKPEIVTLADQLRKAGFRTGAFTGDSGFSAVLGYNKGFEIFTDELPFGGLANSEAKAWPWLDSIKGQRFFMMVHGYDAHGQSPNVPPPAIDNKTRFRGTREEQAQLREAGLRGEMPKLNAQEIAFWRDWYDKKISMADTQVGAILEGLGKRGLLDKTLIVVLSDHGTEFFEHGHMDHGYSLYDELVHVPFMIARPGQTKAQSFDAQVATLNLTPTVLDLLGVKPSPEFKKQMWGQSLAPALKSGKWPGEDVFTETDYRNYTHRRALRSKDGWKYIMTLENGHEELFDITNDPGEKLNVADKQPKRRDQMKRQLMDHLAKMPAATRSGAEECLPVYAGDCE